jgi:hypothetical protein
MVNLHLLGGLKGVMNNVEPLSPRNVILCAAPFREEQPEK